MWRYETQQVVDGGGTAALRARVGDATGASDEAHHVAGFATTADGLLVGLVEVRAEVEATDPSRRPGDGGA